MAGSRLLPRLRAMATTGVSSTVVDTATQTPPAPSPPAGRARWIDEWRPEDETFWERTGAAIARRNLIFSILSEHVGFSIWSLWSVFVLFLGPEYGFDAGQKFLLTTLPAALGAAMRVPYTLAVRRFGGRNWTLFASSVLLVPCAAAALVLRPGISFGAMLAAATLAGFGGGNFSSSMSNIDSFYPQRLKGWALGLNAGGGNLGVATVQLVGLLVLATVGKGSPWVLLAVYTPLVLVSVAGAWYKMDNLTDARNEKRAMRDVVKDGHTAIISFLYIGTFGSFIGFGFAFGQVLTNQFADIFDTPIKATYLTVLGPLLGSLIRPIGGRLADKHSGSWISLWNFAAMTVATGVVLVASKSNSLALFVIGFISLFVLTGVGNGSVYKMIPAIFKAKATTAIAGGTHPEVANHDCRRLSGALVGLAGAIGAFGGVLVNLALRQSFLSTKTFEPAYIAFIAFYAACFVVTWYVYVRPSRHKLQGV
jgi:NNP family nitrate/nitrite transporter-like MFS transporter